ncbi:hypothetical protein [Escherichia coli]|nr:hypothetical protein [Escherichia coli]
MSIIIFATISTTQENK